MFAKSSFSLGVSSGTGPDCLMVTGSPRGRRIVNSLGTLILGQLVAEIGSGNGVPMDVVISRLPALCFRGVSHLVNATHSGGMTIALNFRRLPRLRTSCNGINVRGVVAAYNGVFVNTTHGGRALR